MTELVNKCDKKILLKEALALPNLPGCYLMNGVKGVIYIGKAKNLKKRVSSYFRNKHDLNIKTKGFESILGEDSNFNSKRIREIFKGKDDDFSIAVSLNAAAGLIVAEKNKNFKESYQLARNHLLSGKAYSHLEKISNFK